MTIRGVAIFLAGALAALGAGWLGLPRVLYKTQNQPVEFSHKVHTEKAGSACEDCHSLRADGSYTGLPALDKCSGCHAAAMGNTAQEKAFIDNYVTPNREPQWLSYARQPENVYFPHAPHIKRAGLKCVQCHGPDGELDKPRVYQEDRISGYTRDIWGRASTLGQVRGVGGMKMDDCVACHRQSGLSHSCLDCHK